MVRILWFSLSLCAFLTFGVFYEVASAYTYNDSLCMDSSVVRIDSLEQQTPEQGGNYYLAYWGFIFIDAFNDAQDTTLKVNISPVGDITSSNIWAEIWILQTDGSKHLMEKLYTSVAVSGDTIINDSTITFDLSGFTFENNTEYGVVLNTDLLYSLENYYGIYVNCPDDSPVLVSRYFLNDGTYYFPTEIVSSFRMYTAEGEVLPTSTTTESTSTVNAIYAVGQSIQMYFGILLLLLFGTLSYKFFKPYLT